MDKAIILELSFNRTGIAALGVLLFSFLFLICSVVAVPLIEHDLLQRSTALLRSNGIESAGISFEGRDAILTGAPIITERARQIVSNLRGVRTVKIQAQGR
jgi:hypothetical protein